MKKDEAISAVDRFGETIGDLNGHDRATSAFVVYLHLWRRQLVGTARKTLTDIPVYTVKRPWRR